MRKLAVMLSVLIATAGCSGDPARDGSALFGDAALGFAFCTSPDGENAQMNIIYGSPESARTTISKWGFGAEAGNARSPGWALLTAVPVHELSPGEDATSEAEILLIEYPGDGADWIVGSSMATVQLENRGSSTTCENGSDVVRFELDTEVTMPDGQTITVDVAATTTGDWE